MDIARVAGQRSLCVRRQVGAVVVNVSNRLVSTGYAGPPAGLKVNGSCFNWCPRAMPGGVSTSSYDNCATIHAEHNALLFVDRSSISGGTIYVTSVPCWVCAKSIANSGLVRVVFELDPVADAHRDPDRSIRLLKQCGLIVDVIDTTEGTELNL